MHQSRPVAHACATFATLTVLVAVDHAAAQWSSNPALNLAVCNAASDQNQPKIRPTSDGGCYISWFDGQASGWDVRLQRLDAEGHELWAHNGVLVADLTLSFVNDYGLAVDGLDNAVLAFQDTRFGGTLITCAKITPAGAAAWGGNGVQVSLASSNSPHVAALSDGNYVVGWTEGSNLKRQKLNSSGVPQWTAGGLFEAPPASNSDLICDVIAADAGNVMIAWSRNPSRFLHAQKYDSSGAPLWNAGSPVVVFNGSALQFGYFPTFLHDGAGGAVFGWYETGGVRNAYVQRLSATGVEVFAHNGVACSTSSDIKLTPALAFNQSSGDIFLFWTQTNSVQNMWGLHGQKFTGGLRQWTDAARVILPLSALQNANVRAVISGGGAVAFWSDQPGGGATLFAARLDGSGNFTWPGSGIVQFCSTASSKARLDATRNSCGDAMLAWSDGRSDGGDIYAQNIHPDAVLGNKRRGDVNGDNSVNVNDLLGVISAWGPCPSDAACPADVAPPVCGDGTINVNDLLMVINNWG